MILKLAYKISFFALFCFVVLPSCEAHKANEAFFTIGQTDSAVIVEAEFPWSIRNALLKIDSSLDNNSRKEDYTRALYNYFKEHFFLYDSNNRIMKMSSFRMLDQKGHNHQSNFEIIYLGTSLSAIRNSLFIDQFNNQTNYHFLFSPERTYTTSKTNDHFSLSDAPTKKKADSKYFAIFLLMIGLLVSLVIKYKKAKTSGVS